MSKQWFLVALAAGSLLGLLTTRSGTGLSDSFTLGSTRRNERRIDDSPSPEMKSDGASLNRSRSTAPSAPQAPEKAYAAALPPSDTASPPVVATVPSSVEQPGAAFARALLVLERFEKAPVGLLRDEQNDREEKILEALLPLDPKDFLTVLVRTRSTMASVAIERALSERLAARGDEGRAEWERLIVSFLGDLGTRPLELERLASLSSRELRDPGLRVRAGDRLRDIATPLQPSPLRERLFRIAEGLYRPQ